MQKHPEITRARLTGFMEQTLLYGRLYTRQAPVDLAVFSPPGRIPFAEAVRGRYRKVRVGETFGPIWSTHWFKLGIAIPRDWRGAEVHLRWDSSSEACVWQKGVPLQGLTGTRASSDDKKPIRTEFVVTRRARGGERLTLYVEMACNQLIASEGIEALMGKLRLAEIAVFDRRLWDLIWDFTVISEMATELPPKTPRAAQALFAGNEMLNRLDVDDPRTWPAARAVAAKFFATRNGGGQHRIAAVGHAHLDTAWLWPLAETKRKCYRTFSTALRYMETYPDYTFAHSQAQHYEWMKQEQPALYANVKRLAKDGRFVPVGGTWVEPDCNIPSGESLVRQFLFGQRFFKREFGALCREFWNPDVFGYNGQLPQIMAGAGIRYFLTQKLSWNQFNKPRSHTFWWEGIDGSRILTHFPPADTYCGLCTVKQLLHSVANYGELDRSGESLYLFGYGDGGGGPTPEMLERLSRMRDVDGLPRVEMRSPKESLPHLEQASRNLTTQVGEMYFEQHRGTYTTQAANKLHNRRAEDLLHDIELLASVGPGPYPAAALTRLWKLALLNQFHDIIPGSSITQVHRESREQYAAILAEGAGLRDRAIARFGLKPGKRLAAVNTLSAARTEVVELPGPRKRLGIVMAPAMGYAVQEPVTTVEVPVTIRATAGMVRLENRFVRAVFRKDGTLVSLFDKRAQRETMAGNANRFVVFGEANYDAWNVEVYHLEQRREVAGAKAVRITERGALRVAVEFRFDISPRSHIRQVVSLDALSPRLDFACEVEWRERHSFLKVEFPTTLRSDHATYEIQFGHLSRPTHFNTSYDLARFEVCAHRWADLGEPGFGLALLNDCKYGYAVHGSTMRLSLLRSPQYPDPVADMGRHRFRYALLPHPGTFQEAGVVHEARRFNAPMRLCPTGADLGETSWFTVEPAGVVIDTVKQAEDSDDLIVRLYEAGGTRTRARLRSCLPVQSVTRCNLLEEEEGRLAWRTGGVSFDLSPFQVVTLKLRLRAGARKTKGK
jgi:alpha-mannosidase